MPTEQRVAHIQGPWRRSWCNAPPERHGIAISYMLGDEDGHEIAYVYDQDDAALATARLIEAAPDMLAALKHHVRWHAGSSYCNCQDCRVAKAAIAKAEGVRDE